MALQQQSGIRNSFKAESLHVESIPVLFDPTSLAALPLSEQLFMVPLIPRSGSGSPCEATSNGPGLGEALCVLKRQICVSLRCFRWEKLHCALIQKRKNGGAERRTRACRPSEGLQGEFEDHEDDTD